MLRNIKDPENLEGLDSLKKSDQARPYAASTCRLSTPVCLCVCVACCVLPCGLSTTLAAAACSERWPRGMHGA